MKVAFGTCLTSPHPFLGVDAKTSDGPVVDVGLSHVVRVSIGDIKLWQVENPLGSEAAIQVGGWIGSYLTPNVRFLDGVGVVANPKHGVPASGIVVELAKDMLWFLIVRNNMSKSLDHRVFEDISVKWIIQGDHCGRL